MIFFDTDYISSFLWVKREHLLVNLNLGQLMLPQEVFRELSNPSIPHLGRQVQTLLSTGNIQCMDIITGTEEARLFYQMVYNPEKGRNI